MQASPRIRFNKEGSLLAVTTSDNGIKILANSDGQRLIRMLEGRTFEGSRIPEQINAKVSFLLHCMVLTQKLFYLLLVLMLVSACCFCSLLLLVSWLQLLAFLLLLEGDLKGKIGSFLLCLCLAWCVKVCFFIF